MTPRLTRYGNPDGPWHALGFEPLDDPPFGGRIQVHYGDIAGTDDGRWRIRLNTATTHEDRLAGDHRAFRHDLEWQTTTYRRPKDALDALVTLWRYRHHDRLNRKAQTP